MFSIIKKLVSLFPKETIVVEGKPYLTRYYMLLRDWRFFNIYVHHFHMGDLGDDLHSHPWNAISFIVSGGYMEEYRTKDNKVDIRFKFPGDFNIVRNNSFHRVTLMDEEKGSWTVFIAGSRKTSRPEWGFWNQRTKEFKDWRENPTAIP